MTPYSVQQTNNVTIVRYKAVAQIPHHFLLRSDVHHDSVDSNRQLETKHLKQALEKDAAIIDIGDLFDVMQGRDDKRGSKGGIKEEYKYDNYINSLIKDFTNYYKPYAQQFLLVGYGNHETKFLKYREYDLIEGLTDKLNDVCNTHTKRGAYSGYKVIIFDDGNKGRARRYTINYHHGAGGNAPMTFGALTVKRKAAWAVDADLYLSGHNHNSWIIEYEQERLDMYNRIKYKTIQHVKIPSYKFNLNTGFGYEVEKDLPPSPQGAYWLTLQPTHSGVDAEIVRAK